MLGLLDGFRVLVWGLPAVGLGIGGLGLTQRTQYPLIKEYT